jgi:hypothetical protein
VDGTVFNNSSENVEIPKVGGFHFGFGGLCRNYWKKSNGESLDSKEYFHMIGMADMPPGPWKLETETLRPGEKRHFIFHQGYALVPMTVEYKIECDFPAELEQYRQHNLILDHPILSGRFVSNTLTVHVQEAEGVDRLVYERYWSTREKRSKTESYRNDEYWELLRKYPQAKLAEQLLYGICSFGITAIELARINMQDKIGCSKWKSDNPIHDRERLREINKTRYHNNLTSQVLNAHPESRCAIMGRLFGAFKFIDAGQYSMACRLLEGIPSLIPRGERDEIAKGKAAEGLKLLREQGCCNSD